MQKIGELLISKGLLTKPQLEHALNLQAVQKGLIGKIMVSENYLRVRELQQVLAESYKLPFVDLNNNQPDLTLLDYAKRDEYFKNEILPYKISGNRITLAITNLSDEVKRWSAANYNGYEVNYVITSPFDILWALQKFFASNDDDNARFALIKTAPEYSARKLFSLPFTLLIIAGLFLFQHNLYNRPEATFLYFGVVFNASCFLTISYKVIVFAIGALQGRKEYELPSENLPVYTVMVPLFREEKSIKRLIAALEKLDYPKSRLDIKFVVENDDEVTINAIKKNAPPQYMEILRVPYSLPRTKPKACNYALNYARGEFVAIFDAEDNPDPLQLKKALAKFIEGGSKLACVQARLNYYNANRNLLTRWFSLEYATWFEVVINGLEKIKSPIPLGGTSNHVRTNILKEIGGWDAYNVTEDADLGMRLAQKGYKCATINSITTEEAPRSIWPWLKQRTRWFKGFMQTYFVHMRRPISTLRNTGLRGFATLQFFLGLPFMIYLLLPIWFGMAMTMYIPPVLAAFAMFNFIYSIVVHIIMAVIAERKLTDHSDKKLFRVYPLYPILTLPVYGILHVMASYLALYQLIFKPHYWNKTEHGHD